MLGNLELDGTLIGKGQRPTSSTQLHLHLLSNHSLHLKMSFLGNLFGISTPPPPQSPGNDDFSAAANILNATQFSSAVPPASPSASPSTPSSFPSDADLGATPTPAVAAPSAADMLGSQFDVAKLHPMAELGDNLDFLALDEDKLSELEGAGTVLPSRGWTDDLCVGTGTTYLSGESALGGQ